MNLDLAFSNMDTDTCDFELFDTGMNFGIQSLNDN